MGHSPDKIRQTLPELFERGIGLIEYSFSVAFLAVAPFRSYQCNKEIVKFFISVHLPNHIAIMVKGWDSQLIGTHGDWLAVEFINHVSTPHLSS